MLEEMKRYDRGDGICIHLQADNRCEIYEKRPNFCNGQYVYEHYFSHMTVNEFHKIVAAYCEKIREEELH